MNFTIKCFLLAIRAFPHLLVSKFFYEMKWGVVCGGIAIVSIFAVFTSPVFIIFLPISLAAAQSATSLGTLHSMLSFVGLSKGYNTEYLVSEIIKTSFVRGMGYIIVFAIVCCVLLLSYGYSYLVVALQDFQYFLLVEEWRLNNGHVPALAFACILFCFFTLAMEALLAVPMAAAAYGIGPSDRDFNGFWGIGFQWQKILLTWITAALSILVFAIVSLDLLTEEFHASSVVHLIVSYTTGQAPDFVAHPINIPVFDTAGAQAIGVILMFFCVYLPSPFWVATCVVAFREALAVEEKERIRNLPTKAELLEQQRAKSKKAETLWKQRMPGALKPPQ